MLMRQSMVTLRLAIESVGCALSCLHDSWGKNINARVVCRKFPLFTLILVSGCSYTPEYPANWANRLHAAGCPDVSGEYLDIAKGENFHSPFEQYGNPDNYVFSLNSMVFLGLRNTDENVDFVRVRQSGSELIIEAHKDNKVLRKKTIKYTGDDCRDGFLMMKVPEVEGGESILAIQRDVYGLSKAGDGALVIRYESSAIGIYFIPVAGTQWMWHRFPAKPVIDNSL